MIRQNSKIAGIVVSLIAVSLVVSSCGRRGKLEAPESATVITTDQQGNQVKKTAPKPDRPFILDGLI